MIPGGSDRGSGAGIKVFCFFSSEKKPFLVTAQVGLMPKELSKPRRHQGHEGVHEVFLRDIFVTLVPSWPDFSDSVARGS
jgi:hypothetical protein